VNGDLVILPGESLPRVASKRCMVCGEQATHHDVVQVPHRTISRIGKVFDQFVPEHEYFCAEHPGMS
jgi:hypothetical protein